MSSFYMLFVQKLINFASGFLPPLVLTSITAQLFSSVFVDCHLRRKLLNLFSYKMKSHNVLFILTVCYVCRWMKMRNGGNGEERKTR